MCLGMSICQWTTGQHACSRSWERASEQTPHAFHPPPTSARNSTDLEQLDVARGLAAKALRGEAVLRRQLVRHLALRAGRRRQRGAPLRRVPEEVPSAASRAATTGRLCHAYSSSSGV